MTFYEGWGYFWKIFYLPWPGRVGAVAAYLTFSVTGAAAFELIKILWRRLT